MSPRPLPPHHVPLAYSVPSLYANLISISYINGVFRVTFFEQHLSQDASGSPELREVLVPRTSVTLTPATLAEFLRTAGEVYSAVASQVAAADAFAQGDDGEGTLQ